MKVSVITTSFNSVATIRDTIESVLWQTYGDLEYIIVDGASTDGTVPLVESYVPRFGPRLRDSLCTQLIESILHDRYRENPTPFVNYYVAFFASAYLGVITRWIETGMHETSQEMALISQRLLFIKPGESITL